MCIRDSKAAAKGKEIRKAYIDAIPGLKQLLEAVHERSKEGHVFGIDRRKILVDSQHKSLNYLLQGSAACIAKRWLVMANEHPLKTPRQLAFVHDELQFEVQPEEVNDLKFHLELSAVLAGEYYNTRCPIAAEAKAGANWAEVH